MSGKRGRPSNEAHATVMLIAEGLMTSGGLTPHEAVRQAIDAAVDMQLDAGQLVRRSSQRHSDAMLTQGTDADAPPPWPVGSLDARDTVVEQIATKLRKRIAAKR